VVAGFEKEDMAGQDEFFPEERKCVKQNNGE
jgi:hypothetical protein